MAIADDHIDHDPHAPEQFPYHLASIALDPLIEHFVSDSSFTGWRAEAFRGSLRSSLIEVSMPSVWLAAHIASSRLDSRTSRARHQVMEDFDLKAWRSLFRRLPILRKLIEDRVLGCQEFIETTCRIVQTDSSSLRHMGWVSGPLDPVGASIAGDLHEGGSAVVAVQWANGQILFLKPRSAAAESSVARLATALGEPFASVISTPDSMTFGNHSWQTRVLQSPRSDFPRSCGLLLAFAYVTATTDLHADNVIQSSAGLSVIDAECYLGSGGEFTPGSSRAARVANIYRDGLESICIAPMRVGGDRDVPGPNWSLFGGEAADDWGIPRATSVAAGTGELVVRSLMPPAPPEELRRQRAAYIIEHGAEFIEGFREGLAVLTNRAATILSEAAEAKLETRLVVRPTQLYADLLKRSFHPTLLREEGQRQRYVLAQLDQLDVGSDCAELYAMEASALENGYIPSVKVPFGTKELLGVPLDTPLEIISRRSDMLRGGDAARLLQALRMQLVGYLMPDIDTFQLHVPTYLRAPGFERVGAS